MRKGKCAWTFRATEAERCAQLISFWITLAICHVVGYAHSVKTIADSRRRITLPNTVKEGDVFDVEEPQSGRFVVVKLAKPQQSQVKLVRKNGLLLGYTGRTISWEETRKAMDEFP